jgi:hypothetical protein
VLCQRVERFIRNHPRIPDTVYSHLALLHLFRALTDRSEPLKWFGARVEFQVLMLLLRDPGNLAVYPITDYKRSDPHPWLPPAVAAEMHRGRAPDFVVARLDADGSWFLRRVEATGVTLLRPGRYPVPAALPAATGWGSISAARNKLKEDPASPQLQRPRAGSSPGESQGQGARARQPNQLRSPFWLPDPSLNWPTVPKGGDLEIWIPDLSKPQDVSGLLTPGLTGMLIDWAEKEFGSRRNPLQVGTTINWRTGDGQLGASMTWTGKRFVVQRPGQFTAPPSAAPRLFSVGRPVPVSPAPQSGRAPAPGPSGAGSGPTRTEKPTTAPESTGSLDAGEACPRPQVRRGHAVAPPCDPEAARRSALVEALADALAKALAKRLAEDSGGIDFSSLELRYLSMAPDSSGIEYSFRAATSARGSTVLDGMAAAVDASDAFFIWLALPRETFWVNLKPNEPDKVVDPRLGRTVVGKIMLQADLELKRTDARLLDPRTRFGAKVWRATDRCIPGRRLWITPGVATVREDADSLYIVDAPLRVKVEHWVYRPGPRDPANPGVSTCRGLSAKARQRHVATYQRLVVPRLNRAVNHDRRFADLRRIYLSRIAAEWYRDRSQDADTAFRTIIDSGRIDRWAGTGRWRPQHTFRAYLRSWTHGEYTAWLGEGRVGNRIVRTGVRVGGVDFAHVPRRRLDAGQFRARHAGLAGSVDRALETGADVGRAGGWIGGASSVDPDAVRREFPDASSGKDSTGPTDATGPARYVALALVAAGVLLVGAAALRLVRRRKHHTQGEPT